MKNIIKSLLSIVAVAAIAGGATWAYFTDSKTVNNNTFSTGTVKISVENPNGTLPFKVTGMAPGDSEELRIDIENTGSLDVTLSGNATGAWDGIGGDAFIDAEYKYWNGSGWVDFTNPNPELKSGKTLKVKVILTFDSNADNTYQNKTFRASFNVDAEQKH